MRLLILIILFTGLIINAYGQPRNVYISQSNGSWNNISTWDLGIPSSDQTGSQDDIIITHNITLIGDLNVKSGTTLTIEGCDTLYVTGDITFNNGSSIQVDPCAVLITDGNVINNNNSDNVIINGTFIINGNYEGGTGSELNGSGSMDIDGTVTTDGNGTVFGSESDCTNNCSSSGETPLPISLIDFSGRSIDNYIEINWTTASEFNNEYFVVKRFNAEDSIFSNIAYYPGAGNSNDIINYSIVDHNPEFGINYYQLTQVDYNGNKESFNIISVKHDPYKIIKGIKVILNPIPKYNDINIQILGLQGKEVVLLLMDSRGVIYREKAFLTITNDYVVVLENTNIPAGIYLVIGSSENILYRSKVIIN